MVKLTTHTNHQRDIMKTKHMTGFEIDAVAKAFEAANVGDSPDAGSLGLAIIQLVNDLGTRTRERDRARIAREQDDLPLQLLRYVMADMHAPKLLAGGHCGDRVDMWHEGHSQHLTEICDLVATHDANMDGMFDAIQLIREAIAGLMLEVD